MDNSVISDNNLIDKPKVVEVVKIIYKCPDYILRAQRTHYNKKKLEDPEYLEKEKERVRKYREANRDHVNELARIRRQKKKAEEKAKQEQASVEQKQAKQENKTETANDSPNIDIGNLAII